MTAEQDGPDTVSISWTPPPAPPANGYWILVSGARNVSTNETGTNHTIGTANQLGVFIIQVASLSDHFPGPMSAPVEVRVTGREQFCDFL